METDPIASPHRPRADPAPGERGPHAAPVHQPPALRVTPTEIPAVLLVEPRVFRDHRGSFCETWHARRFREAGLDLAFVQDNHSRSARGVLRGLHYQVGSPQGKLVRVASGEVFDVAVDLRRGSPTWGKWVGIVLSAENACQLWVPPGFAHGFYVTGDHADVIYKCTSYYAPEAERTLRWDDPSVGIAWPVPAGERPVISEKDARGLPLAAAPACE
jgi:dTDP-4-dehydrorhamnose 3,5-epimerase